MYIGHLHLKCHSSRLYNLPNIVLKHLAVDSMKVNLKNNENGPDKDRPTG